MSTALGIFVGVIGFIIAIALKILCGYILIQTARLLRRKLSPKYKHCLFCGRYRYCNKSYNNCSCEESRKGLNQFKNV